MRLFEAIDRWVDKQQVKVLRSWGFDEKDLNTLPVLNVKEANPNLNIVACDYCGQPRQLKKTCDFCGGKPNASDFQK